VGPAQLFFASGVMYFAAVNNAGADDGDVVTVDTQNQRS